MGATEDIKTILQDVVTPDMKDIKDRLTALENKVDDNTRDLTSLLERKHTEVMQRLAALEAKQPH
jgi:tetrahydromethanopterin S-methyltransferase subunit B